MIKALFLLTPDPFSVGMARAWLMSGHAITGLWFPARLVNSATYVRDLGLASTTPGLSMHAIARRLAIAPSPVPKLAGWKDAASEMRKTSCDVVISSMYPDRIPPEIIDAYPQRVFNIHPSLLPAYRGQHSLLTQLWLQKMDGCGVTVHLVDSGFDTGDILRQVPVAFREDRQVASYLMELVKTGGPELARSVADYLAGRIEPKPQPASPSGGFELKPNEAILDPNMSIERVKWLCDTIPQLTPLFVRHQGRLWSVERCQDDELHSVTSTNPAHQSIRFAAADGSVHLAVKEAK